MTHLDNETLALAQNAVDDLACMISAAGYREAVRDLIRAAPSLLAEVVRLRAENERLRATPLRLRAASRECRGCSDVAPADGEWCAACIAEEVGGSGD